jgi:LysR family carnitine catabolism transcriptional activator
LIQAIDEYHPKAMNITLKQLRAFAMVARERSFTRASERLHVTQSTLTTSVKILESEIGMRLLDRSTRSMVLTSQGMSFLPVAERLLRDLHESLDELRMTVNRQRGSVVIAAAASFINYVLAPAVAQVASTYPGISVRLSEETTEGVVRLVLTGEADFGVTTLFQEVPTLDTALLLSDVYGAVYGGRHALHDVASPLPWSRLARHIMVGLHRSNGIRALIDLQPKIASRYKNPAYEVGSMSSLQPLLAQGFGYAALPALAAKPLLADGLRFKPLNQPILRRRLYVVKKKGRTLSPSAIALLEAMTGSLARIERDANIEVLFASDEMHEFCKP